MKRPFSVALDRTGEATHYPRGGASLRHAMHGMREITAVIGLADRPAPPVPAGPIRAMLRRTKAPQASPTDLAAARGASWSTATWSRRSTDYRQRLTSGGRTSPPAEDG